MAGPFDALNDVVNSIPTGNTPQNLSEGLIFTINVMIGVGLTLGILGMAYSMWIYTLSAGRPEWTKKAWLAFIWAFIGALVTLASVGLKSAVFNAAGAGSNVSNVNPGF